MVNQKVRAAIAERRLLRICFDGITRIIEPHLLGRLRSGGIVVSAYQTCGGSAADEDDGWKLFRLDYVEDCALLDQTFTRSRSGYRADDTRMREVFCCL